MTQVPFSPFPYINVRRACQKSSNRIATVPTIGSPMQLSMSHGRSSLLTIDRDHSVGIGPGHTLIKLGTTPGEYKHMNTTNH